MHPQTISLGTDDNRKEQFAQYIPIKETLQALLKDPIVWKECTKHEDDTSAHVLSDVRDGSVYKSNTLFRESGISIKLILYQDAFQVVNPLGSAKKNTRFLGFTLHWPTLTRFIVPVLKTCSLCSCVGKNTLNILATTKCSPQCCQISRNWRQMDL